MCYWYILLQLKEAVLGLLSSSAVGDVETTFDNISKLYEAHRQFVNELDKTVSDWSLQTSVGIHLKSLVSVRLFVKFIFYYVIMLRFLILRYCECYSLPYNTVRTLLYVKL